MKNKYIHIPVLLKESIKGLNIKKNGIYIDATFGQGGHSKLLLSKINFNGKLIAFDRDYESILLSKKIFDNRFTIFHKCFSSIKKICIKKNILGKINGILLDLGICSSQIDNPKRGFSYLKNGPLDMRMNNKCGQTASDFINKANENKIKSIFKLFGEEKFSRKIAKEIIRKRMQKKINTTKDLSKLILNKTYSYKKKHPATRIFQAIRIYINNELKELKTILNDSIKILSKKGRISIISFHSLEHRIIKNFFLKYSKGPKILSKLPLTENEINKNFNKKIKLINKIKPSEYEKKKNSRSKNSILHVFEKI